MAIEGMQSILRQREMQYGKMAEAGKSEPDESLKLFFDYIKASNEQIMGVCVSILDNQKILELKIKEIDDKLENFKVG